MADVQKRDASIDFYRVMLMFGICTLHSITQAGHNVAWAANMLSWCVPGFMFISGWFGMRFSFMKVAKLYGISLYCAAVFATFDAVVSGGGGRFSEDCQCRVKTMVSECVCCCDVLCADGECGC